MVSERFGIGYGEIRGRWEPIVTAEEYERGLEILRQHGANKSRPKRRFYLLRNLLWVEVGGRQYKMYGSTPRGRSRNYAYYLTHARPLGKKIHIPCRSVDEQILPWVRGIAVDPALVPAIREVYSAQVSQVTQADREAKVADMRIRLARLRDDEAQLVRLLLGDKISEEMYDQLRAEWKEKVVHIENSLADLERAASRYLNDLEVALRLLMLLADLYGRFEDKQRMTLLQILAKRIIVNRDGTIIGHELQPPFSYLTSLVADPQVSGPTGSGSEQVHAGALCTLLLTHCLPCISTRYTIAALSG